MYIFLRVDVDPCRPNPCLNSGACLHTDDGFVCNCSRGFKGQHCQGKLYPSFIAKPIMVTNTILPNC